MDHEHRKRVSDQNAAPKFFYSYILQFDDDGTFYVGSTNNPAARFTEHAVGVGAVATTGRRFHVRLVHQFETRKEAEYNEKRIARALERGPKNVEAMIDNIDRINQMIRPEKTLSQLVEEERQYEADMRRSFHHTEALVGCPEFAPPAACGWTGETYGTGDWEAFAQEAIDQEVRLSAGLNVNHRWGRPLCRLCVAKIPPEIRASVYERVQTGLRSTYLAS